MADPYDLVPYTEHAYAESHPDHLRVIAALSGFVPEPLCGGTAPRVLELGCGRGGNLLPMAAAWPEATFVGIDRSTTQIRDAARVAEGTETGNVRFVLGDVTDDDAAPEPFDFVLCHGVYSWIPETARPALLRRVRRSLAPNGIAFVSFNTLPGWYRRFAARDWMRFSARSSVAGGPREALGWLASAVSPEHEFYRGDLRAVHERLLATDAAYLTHEYLAEPHHPVYAATFLGEARSEGLEYLGDALPSETALELLPDAIRARAVGLDLPAALTLADFARDTAFRRALLVRSDSPAPRGRERLDPGALAHLRVASRLRPLADGGAGDLESFEGPHGTVQVSGIARQALHALANLAPRSMPCTDLAASLETSVGSLATELFDLWLATGGLDLHAREPSFVTQVSATPRASSIARWHALEGGPITNVWHQEVKLREPTVRFILGALDGRTSRRDLAARVADRAESTLSPGEASDVVRASLDLLARAAILVG